MINGVPDRCNISLTVQCRLFRCPGTTSSVQLEQEKIHKIIIQTAVFMFSLVSVHLQTLSTAHIIDTAPNVYCQLGP
jgi:hypothetical protein